MKNMFFFFGLFLAAINSCDNTTITKEQQTTSEKDDEKLEISTKTINAFRYDDYILSNDAKIAVSDWAKFQELSTQLTFLKKADITFFTNDKDTLKAFIKLMKETIPQTLNSKPIKSRISVLETQLLKLNNDLSLDNYAAEKKLKSIRALLVANSNVIYLINKKLEFDKNNIERPE